MSKISVDFTKSRGVIKPMHAVNNGPAGSKVRGGGHTFDYFIEAGIPYARNHDASFFPDYGGEHTVDVHRIFKNFDADENCPESYDFRATDQYLADIDSVGTKTFYRLGASIEHGIKYGTFPPKDFAKWARICEHIIMHYTEGWANGFNYDIEYWEIWNEPDCGNADGTNPCWQGTREEFTEFFITAIKYLKARFPDKKIGGPAFMMVWSEDYINYFLSEMQKANAPLDFFSYHGYACEPNTFKETIGMARAFLEKYGYGDAELILNEWNYVDRWSGDGWVRTLKGEHGIKGACFVAGSMSVCQENALDMLMYYDARPCGMNGMFTPYFYEKRKGYYPFLMFGKLYKMGACVEAAVEGEMLYCTAAKGGGKQGVMLTYYSFDENQPTKQLTAQLSGVEGSTAEIYLLDEEKDMELIETKTVSGDTLTLDLDAKLFSTYYIEIK